MKLNGYFAFQLPTAFDGCSVVQGAEIKIIFYKTLFNTIFYIEPFSIAHPVDKKIYRDNFLNLSLPYKTNNVKVMQVLSLTNS